MSDQMPCGHCKHYACPLCELYATSERHRLAWSVLSETLQITVGVPRITLRTLCLHIGRRTEYRLGCNGFKCKHHCEHYNAVSHPDAVPGGNCQTCPDWEYQ